jgi:hypothetical protein
MGAFCPPILSTVCGSRTAARDYLTCSERETPSEAAPLRDATVGVGLRVGLALRHHVKLPLDSRIETVYNRHVGVRCIDADGAGPCRWCAILVAALTGHPAAGPEGAREAGMDNTPQRIGGSVKRLLAIAMGLSLMLLVSTASAVNWVTWRCPYPPGPPPPPNCDCLGKVHYTCDQGHFFARLALVDADGDSLGPPTGVLCPSCPLPNPTDPDSVVCQNPMGHHRYYAPYWIGYNYYRP